MKTLRDALNTALVLGTLGLVGTPVLLSAGCGAQMDADNGDEVTLESVDRTEAALTQVQKFPHKEVCQHDMRPGFAHCYARVRTDASGIQPFATTGPSGFGPADLRSAYKIPTSGGAGKIVAIVDAQDAPTAEQDLAAYRKQYGLPDCTTANGCFKKVNQNGTASPLPASDKGWAGEIALDLDMVSAACPDCKILLVEANSASMSDLIAAENTAVKLGASVISNSWGGPEDSSISANDAKWFNHPGVAITVSAGDDGYGAEYPATSAYVTAVGGTSLVKSTTSTRGWTEAVWGSAANTDGGTGSGCSKYITKPIWQKDTGCAKRTAADVSAVADPNTGVAVYDTYGGTGWAVYGGTSAAAPIVAGIFAITGNSGAAGSLSYSKPASFFDVTTGTNGSCGSSYLCTAKAGYDGPTGNGTPNASLLQTATSCVPSCSGKTCGSDGCGGVCGTCATGSSCSSAGQCVAAACVPSCSGKTCGSDGCGGTCGTCATGSSCSSAGQCVAAPTCAHSECTSGTKLTNSCDSCVSSICAIDSYCCKTAWDSICVSEVNSFCPSTC